MAAIINITLVTNTISMSECLSSNQCESLLLPLEDGHMTIVFANAVVSAFIGVFGFLLNLINIAVFVTMGFTEFTNVSLLSLSVADAGALLFLCGSVFLFGPLTSQLNSIDLVAYLAVSTPHVYFLEISGICTVLLALERFICIAVPHRVKSLMTPKRAATVNLLILMFISVNKLLVYVGYLVIENNKNNETEAVFGQISLFQTFDNVSTWIDTVAQLTTFPAIVCVTGATIRVFNKTVKWRRLVSPLGKGRVISNKERKLSQMVLLISTLYIVCLIPDFCATLVMLTLDEFNMRGAYRYILMSLFSVLYNVDAINSTVPFFIYFHMSTKFRKTLKSLFLWTKKETESEDSMKNRTFKISGT
ncbi:lysophosphatidic acid receptor 6 [Biomphalaria glabrata]|nr:lysophosphatidic acid receptor 6 [Biomphalaria glabrata]